MFSGTGCAQYHPSNKGQSILIFGEIMNIICVKFEKFAKRRCLLNQPCKVQSQWTVTYVTVQSQQSKMQQLSVYGHKRCADCGCRSAVNFGSADWQWILCAWKAMERGLTWMQIRSKLWICGLTVDLMCMKRCGTWTDVDPIFTDLYFMTRHQLTKCKLFLLILHKISSVGCYIGHISDHAKGAGRIQKKKQYQIG